jgi:hypothetical protein
MRIMLKAMVTVVLLIAIILTAVGTAWSYSHLAATGEPKNPVKTGRDPFSPPVIENNLGKVSPAKEENAKEQNTRSVVNKVEKSVALNIPARPHFILTGVITGGEGERAIIFHREQKESYTVKVGMKVGNYIVTGISTGSVDMRRGKDFLRLVLGNRD